MPDTSQGKVTSLVSYVPGGQQPTTMTLRSSIDGAQGWFGPWNPLPPMAPPDVKGRQWDYPTGYNLNYIPRGDDGISFGQLRGLSKTCDILRLVIETRKDQFDSRGWIIQPRVDPLTGNQIPGQNQEGRAREIMQFLRRPDRRYTFKQWQRQLLEDMFVIDAATVYRRKTYGGALYSLDLIDGATIKPLLEGDGRAPLPPAPSYQQILHGIPAANFTSDELMYLPRNISTNGVYGYSPVEQIILTVNIAIRRAVFQLDYYREGSLPDAIVGLPKEFTNQQVKEFQQYWDGLLSGNSAERRRMRFVYDNFKYQEIKQPPLKDQYDEWLARVICYAFNIPPEPFVQITNRNVSETQKERATEEGIVPIMNWFKDAVMDPIIEQDFGSPDLEFSWVEDQDVDSEAQMRINTSYVKTGIMSVDEARDAIGLAPVGGEAAKPRAYLASELLDVTLPPEEPAEIDPATGMPVNAPPGGKALPKGGKKPTDDEANTDDEEEAAPPAKKHVHKHAPTPVQKAAKLTLDRLAAQVARKRVARKFRKAFDALATEVADVVRGGLTDKATGSKGKKVADDLDLSSLKLVVTDTEDDLAAMAVDAGTVALAQVGVAVDEMSDLVNQVNETAATWARTHAADLVTDIDQATRDDVRDIIDRGLDSGKTEDEIADELENSLAFSEDRAALIARTEVGNANSQGALMGFKAAEDIGLKVKKVWVVSEVNPCQVCLDNAAAGAIDLDQDFPSGDDAPLAHPNCECVLTSVVED